MTGKVRILMALAATSLMSGTALAQAAGGVAPLPGAADAGKVAAGNREDQAEFNRAAGRTNKKAPKPQAAEAAKPATAADIVAGSALSDSTGNPIGTVESVDAEGAIVANGTTRIRVPLESFGKNSKGLLLPITKAEFDSLVAKATAQKPQG